MTKKKTKIKKTDLVPYATLYSTAASAKNQYLNDTLSDYAVKLNPQLLEAAKRGEFSTDVHWQNIEDRPNTQELRRYLLDTLKSWGYGVGVDNMADGFTVRWDRAPTSDDDL